MLTADPAGVPSAFGLVDLRVAPERAAALLADSRRWLSLDLQRRQLCDLELLAIGACSPLTGFMTRHDYEPVCAHMRLADGTFWPMPMTLDVGEDVASKLTRGFQESVRFPKPDRPVKVRILKRDERNEFSVVWSVDVDTDGFQPIFT